jgi:hypothetical protein
LNFQEKKMNKKLIFGLALVVVFSSGIFYSVQAASREMAREEIASMSPDVRDYFSTLSPREQEDFLALAPWQWEYIVSLDPDERYAYFELEPQERVVFFSLAPDFRIGFLGLVPEERHTFITLRPEERANFFSQRHEERGAGETGRSRVQKEPAMKRELSGRTREKGFSDTGGSLPSGEKPEKAVLGNGNNQGRTGAETHMKQQAPVRADADRGTAISPKQEGKTGADTHMKVETSGGHDVDRGAAKTMSNPATPRKSEPAAQSKSGKETRE